MGGEIDRVRASAGDLVHLGDFVQRTGQADLQALGFAEPPVGFGFGDAVEQVVPDLGEPVCNSSDTSDGYKTPSTEPDLCSPCPVPRWYAPAHGPPDRNRLA